MPEEGGSQPRGESHIPQDRPHIEYPAGILFDRLRALQSTPGEYATFGRSWGYGVSNTDELIDDAETIEGLPFVRLDSVIEFKKMADRPKDREHLRLLRESGVA